MKSPIFLFAVLISAIEFQPVVGQSAFMRGDAVPDGIRGVTDVVRILEYLYLGGTLDCVEAADVNDDGSADIADAIQLLFYLFIGIDIINEPFLSCGLDPTKDELGCKSNDYCSPKTEKINEIGMKMIYIQPGRFLMGSPLDERSRNADEMQHWVNLTCPFYISSTEVTQGQFIAIMGDNPSYDNGNHDGIDWGFIPERPVDSVSWDDAALFCERLSLFEGRTYRLPTEAEWEYSCRANSSTRFWFGDALECEDDHTDSCPSIEPYFWLQGKILGYSPVGKKDPNPWGLYDIHDNIPEWCLDWYGPYPNEEVANPRGPMLGAYKVCRGAGTGLGIKYGRSAYRCHIAPQNSVIAINRGFRIVQEIYSQKICFD